MKGLAPTRMNLIRARRRLGHVLRGADLLRRKREALAAEVFRLARPAADTRARIASRAREGYAVLLAALAERGRAGLRILGWPLRELAVEIAPGQVWGVQVSDVASRPPLRRTLAARGTAPALAGAAAVEAALEFELLADLLLEAAPREMLIRRLGDALGRTSRQVATLEQRVVPRLRVDIVEVRRQLAEREREEHLRLKHLLRRRSRARGVARSDAAVVARPMLAEATEDSR